MSGGNRDAGYSELDRPPLPCQIAIGDRSQLYRQQFFMEAANLPNSVDEVNL
jgi:hypothetical protein